MAVHEYPQSHGSLIGLSDTDHHKQYGLVLTGPAASRPTGPWRKGRIYISEDTLRVSYDTGGGWVDHMPQSYVDAKKPRIVIPHTFTISGEVKVASGDDFYIPPFFVPVPAGQTARVTKARHRINSGTSVTSVVYWANPGAAENNITPLMTTTTTTADTAPHGDVNSIQNDAYLRLVITAVSGVPKNLSMTLYVEYTGVLV